MIGYVTCPGCGKEVRDWPKTGSPTALESHQRHCSGTSPAEALIFERGGHVPTADLRDLIPLVREAVAASEAAGDVVPMESIRPSPEVLAMWGVAPRLECSCPPDARHKVCPFHGDARRAEFDEMKRSMYRRAYEADAREAFAPRPVGPFVGLDAMLPPPSPAAMLGEARVLLQQAGDTRAYFYAEMAETHARRESEAREVERTSGGVWPRQYQYIPVPPKPEDEP